MQVILVHMPMFQWESEFCGHMGDTVHITVGDLKIAYEVKSDRRRVYNHSIYIDFDAL